MKRPNSRRDFLIKSLQLSSLPLIGGWGSPLWAQLAKPYSEGLSELSPNEIKAIRAYFGWPDDTTWGPVDVAIPQGWESYEEIVPHLSPLLLEKVDYLLMINTDSVVGPNNSSQLVPAQQLVVFQKDRAQGDDLPPFPQDGAKASKAPSLSPSILQFKQQTNGDLWKEVRRINTSTGRSPYVRTFSGIFRINLERSISHWNTNPNAGMSHQLYIDFMYDSSTVSGVAIHGSPVHGTLGVKPDSHGCARVHPDEAKVLRKFFMDQGEVMDLPDVHRQDRFGTPLQKLNGEVIVRPGLNALIVLFKGFKKPLSAI